MAKGFADTDKLCRSLVADARKGAFKYVYLLMGEEPFYVDMVCNAVLENCIDESEKDFNEIVCYGADVNADAVITAARRYPMFAQRQLVVVKEAQMMKDLEELAVYCQNHLESTVLVICMMGAKADKRRNLYKAVQKNGVVVESAALRDYEIDRWISSFFRDKGLDIAPDAAALLAESVGTDLSRIAAETGKMLRNLPEGTSKVTVEDVERNIGVSRQYSIFELNALLSAKDAKRALKTAAYIGAAPKFAMPMAVSAIYAHFNRILRYSAFLAANPRADSTARAAAIGVNPYFLREYDGAVRNYPLNRCMAIIALLKEYDYKGKGGDAGEASPGDLLVELVARILN